MEIAETINWILSICGGVSIIGGALIMLNKAYKQCRKPSDDNSHKIAEHDKRLEDLEEKVIKDYDSINEIREAVSLLCQGMIDLIDNRLTNNNMDGLKKTKGDMIKYLASKK